VPGPIAGLGYTRVFNEDFSHFSYNNSGSINDAHRWQRPFGYANDPGTVFVDANHVLHLKYTTSTATKAVLIGTRKSVGKYQGSWRYGYFEASIAIPAGIATYPQFWLASAPQVWGWTCKTTTRWTNGSPLLNSEIDGLEGGWEQNGWGRSGIQQYNTSTHLNTGGGCGTPDKLRTHFNLSQPLDGAFHTYAVLWTPSTVSYYLDGVQTARLPAPSSANQPMYLILGSDVHHRYTGTLPSVSDTQIAWVHVWQK
jgi:beta-glucanase (GH16 family)